MINVSNTTSLARATYEEVCRQPVYYVLLGVFSFLMFTGQYLNLFAFSSENLALREMAQASFPLWGFITALVVSGPLVTREFETQTAVTLLAKPLRRSEFLVGKFLGLFAALALGLAFLEIVVVGTLWMSEGLPRLDRLGLEGGSGMRADVSVGAFLLEGFLKPTVLPLLEGGFLALAQLLILSALTVSLSVFLPVVAVAGLACFVYLLGHLLPHLTGALQKTGSLPLTALSAVLYTVLPHLEDFRAATLDRGGLLSTQTLALTGAYAALYGGGILAAAAALFRNRDIG